MDGRVRRHGREPAGRVQRIAVDSWLRGLVTCYLSARRIELEVLFADSVIFGNLEKSINGLPIHPAAQAKASIIRAYIR